MPTDQPKLYVWPAIFAAVVLLVVAYGGAYYAMVWPRGVGPKFSPVEKMVPGYRLRSGNVLDDIIASMDDPVESGWTTFFAPIHWLDRRIRPHVWEPGR